MRVCTVTCDCCGKEINESLGAYVHKVGMGKMGFEGRRYQFSRWWTFELCCDCFDKGKPTLKLMWPYKPLMDSKGDSAK